MSQKNLSGRGAVHARRLHQFVGHGEEELAEQRKVAVAEAISGIDRPAIAELSSPRSATTLKVGTMLHFHRQHQGDEDQPRRPTVRKREAEIDDGDRPR